MTAKENPDYFGKLIIERKIEAKNNALDLEPVRFGIF